MFRKSMFDRCVDSLNRFAGPMALAGTVIAIKAYEKAEDLEGAIPQIIAQTASQAACATVAQLHNDGVILTKEKPVAKKEDKKAASA